jgi:hypothetical protein
VPHEDHLTVMSSDYMTAMRNRARQYLHHGWSLWVVASVPCTS